MFKTKIEEENIYALKDLYNFETIQRTICETNGNVIRVNTNAEEIKNALAILPELFVDFIDILSEGDTEIDFLRNVSKEISNKANMTSGIDVKKSDIVKATKCMRELFNTLTDNQLRDGTKQTLARLHMVVALEEFKYLAKAISEKNIGGAYDKETK